MPAPRSSRPTGPRATATTTTAAPSRHAVEQLVDLGLTLTQARVYAALLTLPGENPATIAEYAGVPRTKIYEALQDLERYGFATASAGPRTVYQPVPASEAIDLWVQGRLRRRRDQDERDARAGRELMAILPSPPEPTSDRDQPAFESVSGEARAAALLPAFGRHTRSCLDMMVMPPFAQRRREWNVVESHARARGARVRIIVDSRVLAERDRLDEAIAIGAEVRIRAHDHNPVKLLIRDREEAAVVITELAPKKRIVTFVARDEHVVAGLASMFDAAWAAAEPLPSSSNGSP